MFIGSLTLDPPWMSQWWHSNWKTWLTVASTSLCANLVSLTMCLGDIVDQLHDQHSFAYTSTAEQPNLASFLVGCKHVYDLSQYNCLWACRQPLEGVMLSIKTTIFDLSKLQKSFLASAASIIGLMEWCLDWFLALAWHSWGADECCLRDMDVVAHQAFTMHAIDH